MFTICVDSGRIVLGSDNMKRNLSFQLAGCALFAALTAAAAQFSLPVGPIPVSLATFAVYLAGAVLGAKDGAASQAVYLLLGAAGLPVFAGFRGGAQALFGPTGGYLAGYVVCAWIIGALGRKGGRAPRPLPLAASMLLGTAALFALGTCWFLFLTKRGLWESLALCVFPFLAGDAAKIAVCALAVPRLVKACGRVSAGAS